MTFTLGVIIGSSAGSIITAFALSLVFGRDDERPPNRAAGDDLMPRRRGR